MTTAERLRLTVRVNADGSIERGIPVENRASNVRGDPRAHRQYRAWSPHSASASLYRHDAGIPADVWIGNRRTDIMGVTHPHDCSKHLPL